MSKLKEEKYSPYCRTFPEYTQAMQKYHLDKPRMSIDLSDSNDEIRELSYQLDKLLLEIYLKSIKLR